MAEEVATNMIPPAIYLVLALVVAVARSGEYGIGRRGLKGSANAR